MKQSLADKGKAWTPKPGDKESVIKRAFLDYLCDHCLGVKKARRITGIIADLGLKDQYTKEQFQLQIIGPLREVPELFIGTSNRGIYLVESPDDAYETIRFYTHRIRSERKHLKNLKLLAKRNKLFEGVTISPRKESKSTIFFYESGTPSLNDKSQQPYFIVSAILLEGNRPEVLLKKKMDAVKMMLGKPSDFELKSGKLNMEEYTMVLREMSTIEYEYACVCFVKAKLSGPGFKYPKSFYKYAYQFLIDKVLDQVGEARLLFDEYGGKESQFKFEFFKYLRSQNTGFPENKIEQLEMLDSKTAPFVQMADIIAGVFKNALKGKMDLRGMIEEKAIEVHYFPY